MIGQEKMHRARKGRSWSTLRRVLDATLILFAAQYWIIPVFAQNPIVMENAKPGSPCSEWDLPTSQNPSLPPPCDGNGSDGSDSIRGFATDISVNKGQTIFFKIKTDALAYRVDIYRMGYYQGNGARYFATVQPSVALPQSQPSCITDLTVNLIDCGNWATSAQWNVPADATSGIYFAKLTRLDGSPGASHIYFVVRDDSSRAAVLFKTSDTTWQAYNSYGGASIYDAYTGSEGSFSRKSAGQGAYKVSYNRPFITRGNVNGLGLRSFLFNAEYPLVRWLELNGFDVNYISSVDLDRGAGTSLSNHQVFLSVGHDEYWSGPSPAGTNGSVASAGMRGNLEAAVANGLNLAFLSGNEVYWKTRWETSIDGRQMPYRTLVCYKETWDNAKTDPLPNVWTGTWRDGRFSPPADGGRPENALKGVLWTVNGPDYQALTVPADKGLLRFWRNTEVYNLAQMGMGSTFSRGVIGHEWDEAVDNAFRPGGIVHLSSTTSWVGSHVQYTWGWPTVPDNATHALTLFRYGGASNWLYYPPALRPGGLVFAAGTVQWSWGLDDTHDRDTIAPPCCIADLSLQQATVNLLADMGAQPSTPDPNLVLAHASNDYAVPISTITSPAVPWVQHGNKLDVKGTASDVGGVVAGVEVSLDNGGTWHPAVGHESWSYSAVLLKSGPTTIMSRAIDDSGNVEQPGPGLSGTVILSAGDFDGNGIVDLISMNQATRQGQVLYETGLGGNIELGSDWLSPSQGGEPGWTLVAAADFNRDGYTDLVWLNDSTRQATIWYMGGSRGTQMQYWAYINAGSSQPGWTIVAVGDFDRDGVPDIVWMNDTTRNVTVWHMGGVDGSTLRDWTWVYYGTDSAGFPKPAAVPGWHIGAAMDFDRDGVPDLVWVNDSTRAATVWYMGGPGGAYSNYYAWLSSGELGWNIVGSADFNNDGFADIVWLNDSSQEATVWYLGGPLGTTFQSYDFFTGTATGWNLVVPH